MLQDHHGCKQYTTYVDTLKVCNLDELHARREQLSLKIFKLLMKTEHFSSWIPPSRGSVHQRNLRNSNQLPIPMCNTTRCKNSPMVYMTDYMEKQGLVSFNKTFLRYIDSLSKRFLQLVTLMYFRLPCNTFVTLIMLVCCVQMNVMIWGVLAWVGGVAWCECGLVVRCVSSFFYVWVGWVGGSDGVCLCVCVKWVFPLKLVLVWERDFCFMVSFKCSHIRFFDVFWSRDFDVISMYL